MSGGSWDYFTFKADEVAERLESEKSPLRRALGQHMRLIAKALYDIEWVDSGDKGEGDDIEAIKAVFEDTAEAKEMEVLLKDARGTIEAMRKFGA
jgi:hypothetical protein